MKALAMNMSEHHPSVFLTSAANWEDVQQGTDEVLMVNGENHKERGGPPLGARQTDDNAHTFTQSFPTYPQSSLNQNKSWSLRTNASSGWAQVRRYVKGSAYAHTNFTFNLQGFLLYSSSYHTPLLASLFVVCIIGMEIERAACKGTAQTTFKMAINRKP